MSASRIAQRYAKSLIQQSLEMGNIDAVKADVDSLMQLFDTKEFELMVKSPIINADKKKNIFKTIIGGKVDILTEKFVEILINKGREAYLPGVVDAFDEQYDELKKRSKVAITTATPVDEGMLAELKTKIIESKVTHPDVVLSNEVNDDIIGGFVLDIADRQYDASVRGQLEQLKKTFSDDSYSKKF